MRMHNVQRDWVNEFQRVANPSDNTENSSLKRLYLSDARIRCYEACAPSWRRRSRSSGARSSGGPSRASRRSSMSSRSQQPDETQYIDAGTSRLEYAGYVCRRLDATFTAQLCNIVVSTPSVRRTCAYKFFASRNYESHRVPSFNHITLSAFRPSAQPTTRAINKLGPMALASQRLGAAHN